MVNRHPSRLGIWLISLLLMFAASGLALADPPSRVARLSYVDGNVSMQPAGFEEWSEARINRPLITGDSLYSDRTARVEMEVGAATVRLDERTTFRLLNLDDSSAQIELTSGTLNLIVRRVFQGQTYEIDTPTLALVIQTPGQYRVDISPRGDSTMVSVLDGNGDVYGRDNASFRVRHGESYRFYDSQLRDYEVFDLPRQDDFDRWCYQRAERYERSPSRRYVSQDMIGYADLDDYGSWSTAASYGSIWYPSRVDRGWTPYRDGHWSWIDPWGWTWVDDAPWGFAPSHYGRWAYVGTRWGWVPGPRNVRPIYAPALVAFVGGGGFSVSISSGGPVGWFPLGPRDVYVPWYRGSRDYFNNINVHNTTIINNTYITNVYNDYSRGRPVNNFDYAYQNDQRAYTAVSRDAFINARSVSSARVQVDRAQLSQSRVVSRVEMAPTQRSLAGGDTAAGNMRKAQAATFDRQVIARTAPPARRLDAQERIQAISRNNNQPLAADQVRELSAKQPRADERQTRRVEVVGGDRPAATEVPTRTGAVGNERIQRQPANAPARSDSQRVNTPADARTAPARDAKPSDTVRAPRTDRIERTAPATQPARAVDRDERTSRPVTTRPSVERDAPTRTISAPAQGQPTTIRAPSRERVERNAPSTQPAQSDNRDERATRTTTPRAAVERNAPTPTISAPTQRQPVQQRQPAQREEPAQRESKSSYEQRVIPQSAPRYTPPQERREVQPRSAPPAQERQAVQPRPATQTPPAQQPQQRKAKSDEDSKEDDQDDQDNQRKRRH